LEFIRQLSAVRIQQINSHEILSLKFPKGSLLKLDTLSARSWYLVQVFELGVPIFYPTSTFTTTPTSNFNRFSSTIPQIQDAFLISFSSLLRLRSVLNFVVPEHAIDSVYSVTYDEFLNETHALIISAKD
jgi:hypothetical protein